MGKMKVTYMSKSTGHGDMADKHTFIRCSKCDGKYVKEIQKVCPHCGGKGKVGTEEAGAIFKAAVDKEVAKREAAKIDLEVAAENAADEKDKSKK